MADIRRYRETCPLPGVIPPLTAESANWESAGARAIVVGGAGAYLAGAGAVMAVVAG